jgi:hypothetical protein
MHAYPINTFQATIRKHLKEQGIKAIVAQRLKRMPSIIGKLKRFESMSLDRMQDIGGLRIILSNIAEVQSVTDILLNAKWKHRLHHKKDYINSPADSGYRSMHLIYKYNNTQAASEYQDLQIEIQIRTKLQHIWATAVETIGAFINHSLKSSQGPKDWLYFLKLSSEIFALEEKTPLCHQGKTLDELIKELYICTLKLKAFSQLSSFHNTIQISLQRKFKNKYILLILDLSENSFKGRTFNQNQLERATKIYSRLEKRRKTGRDIVLVSTSSLNELRKAYPNYFIDTSEFIKRLKRVFDSRSLNIENM